MHADSDAALVYASEYGHTEVVKVLLDAGADVHARDDYALRWASERGHTETVKVLKDWIAKEKKNVNEKFTEDSDPIHDLGIGKTTWFNLKTGSVLQIKKFIRDSFPKINDYILITKKYEEESDINRIVFDYKQYKNKKDLLKGLNGEKTEYGKSNWTMSYPFFKEYFKIIQNWKLYESVNEKFTDEDSDPISDLGIGIIPKLKKRSLKTLKHKSSQGDKIAAYISHFAMISEEELYDIEPKHAKKLLHHSNTLKQIDIEKTGLGIEFELKEIFIDGESKGIILIEKNMWRNLYWGNLSAAIQAYKLNNF